ncbi:MAG: helix-turn-helix domain-containing protein [Nitrososphaerota archaeon]
MPRRPIGYSKLAQAFAGGEEMLTFKTLLQRTGLSRRALSRVLRELVHKGLVERVALSRKRVFYKPRDPYYLALMEKQLWYELGRPCPEEYSWKIGGMIEAAAEAEEALQFFAALAFSYPKARFQYAPFHAGLFFYPNGLNGEAVDLGEVPALEIPERLNLMQCLSRFLRSCGLAAFTREELERLGIKFDDYGPILWDKLNEISELKKLWGIEYVEKPRAETLKKTSNLIYLAWLKREALKSFIDPSIEVYIL